MCSWKLFCLRPPDQGRQDDLQYASVHFFTNQPDPLYSNVTPARPLRHTEQQEEMEYAAVKCNSARPAPRWAALKLWNKFIAVACFVFIIITIWWKLYDSLLYLFFSSQKSGSWRGFSCIVQHSQQSLMTSTGFAFILWYLHSFFFYKMYIFIRKYSLLI